jgi:hypothetical protein
MLLFLSLFSLIRCWRRRESKLIRCSTLQLMMQSCRGELLIDGYTHPVVEPEKYLKFVVALSWIVTFLVVCTSLRMMTKEQNIYLL